jgi:DNA-binding transcriptional LysR family regulator
MLQQYPDIHLEISADYRMIDIAAERYDIGVRWGDQVEKDMIAVRLAPDMRLMIVGSPSYFSHRPVPASAQDLAKHNCIGLRLASSGGLYAWELRHEGRDIEMRPHGQLVFNGAYQMLEAALSGNGLAFLTEDLVAHHVREGRLVSVMEDWCPHFPGLHAYYPSRRHSSRALALVIDAIRLKG